MNAVRLRVIKLGGSLLDYDRLVPEFRRWLAAQPAAANVMVVGGGDLADAIRAAFVRHGLSQADAHWLCVRLLGVTAALTARLLPEASLVKRFDELQRRMGRAPQPRGADCQSAEAGWQPALRCGADCQFACCGADCQSALTVRQVGNLPHDGPLVLFEPEQFLREVDPALHPAPLPHCWDVTSDSIAARLAGALAADELVLVKSALPECASSLAHLASSGYVDRYFPQAAAAVPVIRCVNLREERFGEVIVAGRGTV